MSNVRIDESKPYHHTRYGFRNPPGSAPFYRFTFEMVKEVAQFVIDMRRMTKKGDRLPHHWIEPEALAYSRMMQITDVENAITWLGHASFLIQLSGFKILTDPFLTDFASPVGLKNLKRLVPAAIPIHKLPKIDVILLSHNHYDHMDAKALAQLALLQPDILVVVPLRLAESLRRLGFQQVVELDWHQGIDVQGASIRAVPAVHFSRRSVFDTNRTLWCGFIVRHGGSSVYFAGDTGYGSVFKEMGEQYGPIEVGLIPIGAYKPRSIMSSVHVSPEEAINIAEDLRVKHIVGMHWGTIRLTTEPMLEPAHRFKATETALDKTLLRIGETRLFEALGVSL